MALQEWYVPAPSVAVAVHRDRSGTPKAALGRQRRGEAPATGARSSSKKPRFAILESNPAEPDPEALRAAADLRRRLLSGSRGGGGPDAADPRTPVSRRRPGCGVMEDTIEEDAGMPDAGFTEEQPAANGGARNGTPGAVMHGGRWDGLGGPGAMTGAGDGTPVADAAARRWALLARPAVTPGTGLVARTQSRQQRRPMVRMLFPALPPTHFAPQQC